MTRNLEAVQGWVRTRRRGVQVNAVQDGSLGSSAAPLRGTARGCAGGTRCDTVRRLRRAPPGRLGLKAFGVAKFTPLLVFTAKRAEDKILAGAGDEARAAVSGFLLSLLPPPAPTTFGGVGGLRG